jgi:hypothetical protein
MPFGPPKPVASPEINFKAPELKNPYPILDPFENEPKI